MKELLSGNAAIARGAFEFGVTVAAAYPGTPSTEILEHFARYPGVYAEWAPNEKVALEVGIGASLAGARVLVAMKHVGVNVAADPLFTLAYTGVNGGLVLVSADDPGMHSSQNEQDNRNYARFAKIPLLEPSDSREARDMVGLALEISEQFDTPVMLRTTTRIAHSQSFVELKEPQPVELRLYQKDARKYLMVPGYARPRRAALAERLLKLEQYTESCPVNFIEWRERQVGIITGGVCYQYVREVLPQASVLKLGMSYPFPRNLVRKFAARVEQLYVVEELDPFIEEQVHMLGIPVTGKKIIPAIGELDPVLVARCFVAAGVPAVLAEEGSTEAAGASDALLAAPVAPARPPVLCPGCPHRGLFHVLRRLKLMVTGDIGCYTLAGLPPLEAMDTCICMGASIGAAHGVEKASPGRRGRTVAVIGDSTFFHSGITGLLNMVYNGGSSTVIIVDNRTTAMTGHQPHPGTGTTLMGGPAPAVDLEMLARALGVKRVRVVDPLDLRQVEEAVREEVAAPETSVIIARRPCVLLNRSTEPPARVQADACKGCRSCIRLGCPAISLQELEVVADGTKPEGDAKSAAKKAAVVDPLTCVGCGLCVQVCKNGALKIP